jgi:hypothetical protein
MPRKGPLFSDFPRWLDAKAGRMVTWPFFHNAIQTASGIQIGCLRNAACHAQAFRLSVQPIRAPGERERGIRYWSGFT